MEIRILKGQSREETKATVSEIMRLVNVFPEDMRADYRDPPYFRKQLLNPENICIGCYNSDGEMTGFLLAMSQNEAWKELSHYDPDFEKDPDDLTYYVEVMMSDSKKNRDSNRSSFYMINELIREADSRGKRFISMHALRNEGLSYVIMTVYPAELVRERVVMPDLYGPDEEFDYLVADIWEYKKRHRKKFAA